MTQLPSVWRHPKLKGRRVQPNVSPAKTTSRAAERIFSRVLRGVRTFALFASIGLAATLQVSAAPQKTETFPATPEAVARELYSRVTWKAGSIADWDKVRALFRKEAVVVLRSSRTAMSVFNLEGFIDDFVRFSKLEAVQRLGFQEKVVRLKATTYGEIANVFVLYEAHIPGHPMAPQQGVDIIQLLYKDGQWSIVSIVNELVAKGGKLPVELQGG